MDISLMQQDFYKRFERAEGSLKSEKCGLLCTLLGFPGIKGALSLTYPLSVGVTGLCRPTPSDKLRLESTDSDKISAERVKNRFGDLSAGLSGGDILLDNEIPQYFDSSAETACCALKCVMHINGFSEYDKTAASSACRGKANISPYLALLSARPGYCVKSDLFKTELLPLPLAGFRLVSIQLDKSGKAADEFDEAESEFDRIRTMYPHLASLADLTQAELDAAKPRLRSKPSYRRLSMILRDNERIRSVSGPLKRCRTSELFNMMNQSSKDFLRLWGLDHKEAMLLRGVLETEGVRAARLWHKGVIAAVYEERVDSVLNTVENAFKNSETYEIKFCISK